ncbi:MAG: YdcH family protein [Wenzhouxiangella sp.]
MNTDLSAIQSRLRALYQEHRDLDQAISQMAENPATDQLQLRRMKKRKLRLRDQIAYWESRLIPDLDA